MEEAEELEEPEPEPELEPELESEPEPEPMESLFKMAPVGVELAAALELEELEELEQDRSKIGVLRSLLTTPKLGLAPSSSSMYHQVLVLPKSGQATSSQYCLALAIEAVASPSWGPLTGQPVSVIQTSLPLATDLVFSTESSKRALAFSIPFSMVSW